MEKTFEINKLIGKGTFGKVYKAKDCLGNTLAVKKIVTKNLDPKASSLLKQEIEVMTGIKHPNIVELKFAMELEESVYMVMEYCEGGDLENCLRLNQNLSVLILRRWIRDIVNVVQYLHSKGIMHRDLKLANLLLSSRDLKKAQVKVADFGFAKVMGQDVTSTQLGSPLYMAPEIFTDESYTIKADIWSLGAVIYEILTLKPLFKCNSLPELFRLQNESVKFANNCLLTQDVKDMILSMLNRDYSLRPSSEELISHPFFAEVFEEKLLEIEELKNQYIFVNSDDEEIEEKSVKEPEGGIEKSQYFEDYEENTFGLITVDIEICMMDEVLKMASEKTLDRMERECLYSFLKVFALQVNIEVEDLYIEFRRYVMLEETVKKLKKRVMELNSAIFSYDFTSNHINIESLSSLRQKFQSTFHHYLLDHVTHYST